MTPQQLEVARALQSVVVRSGTFAKRFIQSLGYVLEWTNPALSEKQAEAMWQVAYTYRKQLPAAAVSLIPAQYHS